MYTAGPDGYCGDEDNGQTSAWHVFSALGFYPVCPGTDEYVLGALCSVRLPLISRTVSPLTIDAPDNSPENMYIESLKGERRGLFQELSDAWRFAEWRYLEV